MTAKMWRIFRKFVIFLLSAILREYFTNGQSFYFDFEKKFLTYCADYSLVIFKKESRSATGSGSLYHLLILSARMGGNAGYVSEYVSFLFIPELLCFIIISSY